ncbi:PREDICTED: ataxin-3 isoform X2 [Chinchilla lanigera]|uniref:ataxin-3 isoform X2 n=1 Tax=Chinchilla lanigera TaxID=34839 RepID=UPI0006981676|nr:PREDICTED: ataxin-3 isoform X2 [Chinchilla lanigera]
MESIFHEKQEGSLCAQHCLNNLLQGEYFSPVELSSIAHQLDEEERMRMAEGGVTSEDYRTFLQQPSGNMDDSGFFSIQVISNALKVWGLELILFNSPEYQRLRIDPINEKSFICNYKEHWFTVRKLGKQWFNLNSLLTGPELISDTYLALFLAQLQQEGYSIFVVKGDLPDCEADQLLQMIRVQQMHRPKLIGEELAQLKEQRVLKTDLEQVLEGNDGSGMLDEDEEDLQRALALSRQEIDMEDEEADLRRAIQLSMQGINILVVAEIYLKMFHRHQVQILHLKSCGGEEKPTLKSSSSNSSGKQIHQDKHHNRMKGQPQVQGHLGMI